MSPGPRGQIESEAEEQQGFPQTLSFPNTHFYQLARGRLIGLKHL